MQPLNDSQQLISCDKIAIVTDDQVSSAGNAVESAQRAFLTAFAETGVLRIAARISGAGLKKHDGWLRSNTAYARQFNELQEQFLRAARDRVRVQREEFFRLLSVGERMSTALQKAGISRAAHKKWLDNDEGYRRAFEQVAPAKSLATQKSWNSERRERTINSIQAAWTPEKREAASRQMREIRDNQDLEVQRSQSLTEAWRGADARRVEHSTRMRDMWAEGSEYRDKMLTRMRDPETRQKLSDAAREQWARMTEEEKRDIMRRRRVHFKGGYKLTKIEATVISALNDLDAWYCIHKNVDGYVADVLVMPNIVVECDGAWFHNQRKDTDEIRDERLTTAGYRVLRLSEESINDGSFISPLRAALGLPPA